MRSVFAVAAGLALAGSAPACINDTELPTHEREFRSQYNAPAAPPSESADPTPGPLANNATPIALAGAVLALGAIAVASRGPTAGV